MLGLLVGAIPSEREDIGLVKVRRRRRLTIGSGRNSLLAVTPSSRFFSNPRCNACRSAGDGAKAKSEEKKLPVGVLGLRGTGGSSSTGGRCECMSDPYILEANEGGSSANLNTLASGFNPFFFTWWVGRLAPHSCWGRRRAVRLAN